MRDMENTRVTVVYREFLDPSEDDPAPRVPNETYTVRNVESAVMFHPRAEIVAYEASSPSESSEAVSTETAKRHLAAWRHQQQEDAEKRAEDKKDDDKKTADKKDADEKK